MIEALFYNYMREMLRQTPMEFHRYLYDEINWDNRLIGILGPRGVGKSTLILQHIKALDAPRTYIFITAESLWFSEHTLLEFADSFSAMGGEYLYIDEIHKYKGWSRELKLIYDMHPALHVVFTGSSILDIKKEESDLSRRVLLYKLEGMSFREYLMMKEHISLPAFTLKQIVNNEVDIPEIAFPLPAFHEYLQRGYYPFFTQDGYSVRLTQIVSQTIEVDIPIFANMQVSTARKLRQLLAVIAKTAPVKPNMSNLSQELGISKNTIPDYFTYLETSGMIGMLRDDTSGLRVLGKLEKVYLDNTNLMYALTGDDTNIGNARETFFYNQTRVRNQVTASRVSDFTIDGMTFEVGGKNKGKKQISEVKQGYVVKDDIVYGYGNVIPLWHFGMNY